MKNKLVYNNMMKFWMCFLHNEVELNFERRVVYEVVYSYTSVTVCGLCMFNSLLKTNIVMGLIQTLRYQVS